MRKLAAIVGVDPIDYAFGSHERSGAGRVGLLAKSDVHNGSCHLKYNALGNDRRSGGVPEALRIRPTPVNCLGLPSSAFHRLPSAFITSLTEWVCPKVDKV